jgi:hypothetical protein
MSEPQTIVIRPTLDELRESRTALVVGQFAFFVQAWRVDALHPLSIEVTGALFFYPTLDEAQQLRGSPSCILGTRGDLPARASVLLTTAPEGAIETWTASALALQDLYITLPLVTPWLTVSKTFHLRNGIEVPSAPTSPDPTPETTTGSNP